MFPLYPFNPFIPIGQRNQIRRIDVGGIYELKTNAQQVTEALAYINKKSGIIRLLGFQQPTGG